MPRRDIFSEIIIHTHCVPPRDVGGQGDAVPHFHFSLMQQAGRMVLRPEVRTAALMIFRCSAPAHVAAAWHLHSRRSCKMTIREKKMAACTPLSASTCQAALKRHLLPPPSSQMIISLQAITHWPTGCIHTAGIAT